MARSFRDGEPPRQRWLSSQGFSQPEHDRGRLTRHYALSVATAGASSTTTARSEQTVAATTIAATTSPAPMAKARW